MEHVSEEKIGNYIVRVFQDENPSSPREDDNLTRMICFHGRYNLGDKHDFDSNDFDSWDEMEKYIIATEKPIIIKPLYLYDHSGITISTSPFSCRWDSGRIGFVFITKESARKNFSVKRCTKDIVEKCEKILEAEVDTYDKYLRGGSYGFRVYEVSGCDLGHKHEEELESCWGFNDIDECMTEGKCYVPDEVLV